MPCNPLDLTLTPVAPTSMRRDATQQQHSAGPVHLRCRLDEHISRFYPNHQPTAQEHLRAMLYMHGATEDTLLDYLERYNRGWDRIIASSQMEEFLHLEKNRNWMTLTSYIAGSQTPSSPSASGPAAWSGIDSTASISSMLSNASP
ncbi:hypothetical protein SCLCIDRAFT_669635 [Scleroderma citrinum Foug A]|uniref:Uncharacterized protein n=1 Tax=Scleroderma citrinum Foug A TaxID=1036808 RepID=A0A0C3AFZ2_9AGAM|nr:hypothetical protein SCLCIDRAFT_669635 [Scleroderma citrinum Foug A]